MMEIRRFLAAGLVLFFLTACGAQSGGEPTAQSLAPTQSPPAATVHSSPTPVQTSAPVSTASPISLWMDPNLPDALQKGVRYDDAVRLVKDSSQAEMEISLGDPSDKNTQAAMRWSYVLAARFPTLDDNVSLETIKRIWKGGDAGGHTLILSSDTQKVFALLWGLPNVQAVQVIPPEGLLDAAWTAPYPWAILPFEAIEPRWKVLKVDGFDPLDRSMDETIYPLSVNISLSARDESSNQSLNQRVVLPPSNREPSQLVTLAMTGTTALVRKTAGMMNTKGVAYPARDIGALLRSADLTHISNEVSFNQDCPPARAASGEGIFCSAPAYIQLLEAVGADIIELTGNHNLDKGEEAYRYTLGLYQQRHWGTYGGGLTQDQARQPLLIERGGTRLAFLGCNMAGPDEAWAGANSPGAATCDIPALEKQVRDLRGQGILPIVTFQAFETEDYMPAPMQRPSDFRRMAQAGAVIVSGSQAHFPQGFGFEPGSLIHYGLGNLFFDQVQPEAIRRSFIDWYVFYGGKYLGAELITILEEDYGKPRLMNADERRAFLADVFKAEGW